MHKFLHRPLLACSLIAAAQAGDVRFEFYGTVSALSPAPMIGPLAGASVGDAVVIELDVEIPATTGVPNFSAGYTLDLATSSWTVGASTGGFTLGGVIILNGLIAGEDWVRALNQQIAPGERLDIALDDPTGTVFPTPDVLGLLGHYPSSTFVTDTFEFTAADGGVVEVSFQGLLIGAIGVGFPYCFPAVPNSTGVAANIAAQGSWAVASNDFSLAAWNLPQASFGYFVASQTQALVPGAGGSQGTLCLGGSVGRFNAQVMNSGLAGAIWNELDLTNFPQPTGAVAVQPGETWSFQVWYRDANPGTTSNFSSGVAVTFS